MNLARHFNARWLGRMQFARALELQEELVAKKRGDASLEDQLLLLEHEPVYTIGRTPDRSSLSATGGVRCGKRCWSTREYGKYRHYDDAGKLDSFVRRGVHCLFARVKPLLSNLSIPC